VVRAHTAALSQGLSVIAITDSDTPPIAREARIVSCLPMEGPQPLPSHGAGLTLVEAIVAEMIASDADAPGRIAALERQVRSGATSRETAARSAQTGRTGGAAGP
jgi:DNA-binding MurR/RpiR family transcriptional regulator